MAQSALEIATGTSPAAGLMKVRREISPGREVRIGVGKGSIPNSVMAEMRWRKQTDRTSKALELRALRG
jgi:hypothetical protein